MATKASGGYLSLAKLAIKYGYTNTGNDIEMVLAQYFPSDAQPRVEANGLVSTGSQQEETLSIDGLPQERGYRAFGPTSTMVGVGDIMIIDGAIRMRYPGGDHLELKPFPLLEVFINCPNSPALPCDSWTKFKVADKIYIGSYEIIKMLDVIICLDKMKGPIPRIARGVAKVPGYALATFVMPGFFLGILFHNGLLMFHPSFDMTLAVQHFAILIITWFFIVVIFDIL